MPIALSTGSIKHLIEVDVGAEKVWPKRRQIKPIQNEVLKDLLIVGIANQNCAHELGPQQQHSHKSCIWPLHKHTHSI